MWRPSGIRRLCPVLSLAAGLGATPSGTGSNGGNWGAEGGPTLGETRLGFQDLGVRMELRMKLAQIKSFPGHIPAHPPRWVWTQEPLPVRGQPPGLRVWGPGTPSWSLHQLSPNRQAASRGRGQPGGSGPLGGPLRPTLGFPDGCRGVSSLKCSTGHPKCPQETAGQHQTCSGILCPRVTTGPATSAGLRLLCPNAHAGIGIGTVCPCKQHTQAPWHSCRHASHV